MLTHTEKKLFYLIVSDDLEEFKLRFSSMESFNKLCVNEDGLPLTAFAVQSASPRVLDFLCQDSDLKKFKGPKETPLVHYIVDHMNETVIDVLVKNNFDFNETDRFGKNVLHVAAKVCEHNEFVKLIRLGADINKKSNRGETPKDTLARWGNKNVRIRESDKELNY